MFKSTKSVLKALAITALITMTAVVTSAQTTGSVTMNATVSNFVELTSGGAVTLTGNSGRQCYNGWNRQQPVGSSSEPGRTRPRQYQFIREVECAGPTSQQRSLSTQYG